MKLTAIKLMPITVAADNSCHCFSEKIRLDVSCESSARQRIHMKRQALFSLKDKKKEKSVVCCNFAWLFFSGTGYVSWFLQCLGL